MCAVSMVMEHYSDKWGQLVQPLPQPPNVWITYPPVVPMVTQEEVDEFRRLLERAREYDRKNNEPDCEIVEKKNRVKELAESLGVKIDFI